MSHVSCVVCRESCIMSSEERGCHQAWSFVHALSLALPRAGGRGCTQDARAWRLQQWRILAISPQPRVHLLTLTHVHTHTRALSHTCTRASSGWLGTRHEARGTRPELAHVAPFGSHTPFVTAPPTPTTILLSLATTNRTNRI